MPAHLASGADSGSDSGSDSDSGSNDSDSDSDSDSDDDYSDTDSDDYSTDSEEEREERIAEARAAREAREAKQRKLKSADRLRSPICCILGHVDTGKTKILDKIRNTNVQDGEAGGITQQIGATFMPREALEEKAADCLEGEPLKIPGLLVIDTPGHESFSNLRSRGSGLCDIAVLVVDIMHGLEQQTIESINLLKMRKTPFVVALNKCDRIFDWEAVPNGSFRKSLKGQKEHAQLEFEKRKDAAFLALAEQGLNAALYWENPDSRRYVNVVPTSAITGEGIPDLLYMLSHLTYKMLGEKLWYSPALQCTVLEVKTIEGLGTTCDVILVNGRIKEGDTVVVCGLQGAIVTQVRAVLTPHPMKEMRVKGSYQHHKQIEGAIGVKLAANNLESALAGTQLYVLGSQDSEEELRDTVENEMSSVLEGVDKTADGVCVQASTLGSLEALLEFLGSDDVQIPVCGVNIGPISKKDVMRASMMATRGLPEFAVILAFDIEVKKDARELAKEMGVRIMTADIIYHLFDQFSAYMKEVKAQKKKETLRDAAFPCVLRILPSCVFTRKDPIVVGVDVIDGIARIGTPICVPSQGQITLGRIASIEREHKAVDRATRGQSVAMKIEPTNPTESSRMYGRHFDHTDDLVSLITRKSIDLLKEHFVDEMDKESWRLVVKLKKLYEIV